MRYLLIILMLGTFLFSNSQTSLGLEYQRNIESVQLNSNKNLLLNNTSYLITKNNQNYKIGYGLEVQEALLGEFGGLYVFGLSTDFDYRIENLPITFNINAFIGGGGGASAPDGSGLAYRHAYGIKTPLNPNIDFSLRYSNYSFPTGDISGNQIQVGFSYLIDSVFNTNFNTSKISEQSILVQGVIMDLDINDSGRLDKDSYETLISFEYANKLSENIDGLIRLQAAVSDKIDGFMGYYSGFSYNILEQNIVRWNVNTLIGSCGGGAMRTSGGLSYLLETGIDFEIKKNTISINTGHNKSYSGTFQANYIQCGIKYNFESTIGIPNKFQHKSEDDFKISKLTIKSGLVTRIAPIGTTYNGKEYVDMSLLNFAIYYPITYFKLLAETRWAAFGDYGAYAEGLVGLSIPLIEYKKISISLPSYMVVAGGGGIDVGKGIGVQFNLSTEYNISKNNALSFSVGKLNMYKGNYKPVSFNIGLSQDLFFPLNK